MRAAPRLAAAAAAVVALVALSPSLSGCDDEPRVQQPTTFVVDDFESGAITDWQAVSNGSGGWFVYGDGQKAPDPGRSDPNVPVLVPDPPQGKLAAVTDVNGAGRASSTATSGWTVDSLCT